MALDLVQYITDARGKNVSDDEIVMALKGAGWTENQIDHALSATSSKGLSTPPPVPHVGMWSGFLYIIFFIVLYVFASALAGMLHVWVEKTFPNTSSTLTSTYFYFDVYSDSVVRGYLAGLITSFPLLVGFGMMLKGQIQKQPFIKNLRSRKIMIYITLIVTFLILLSNTISSMYNYLNGDTTSNSTGHFLVTFFVTGAILTYFINEIKNDRKI